MNHFSQTTAMVPFIVLLLVLKFTGTTLGQHGPHGRPQGPGGPQRHPGPHGQQGPGGPQRHPGPHGQQGPQGPGGPQRQPGPYGQQNPQGPPPCQYETYEPTGMYESPGFPDGYPNHADCSYKFFTDKVIDVHFESFGLEESTDCNYDYINVVFDALSPTAQPQKYCGDGLKKVNDGHLRGLGPLAIIFRSDDSTVLQGFKFNYQFELFGADPCLSDPCQNGGTCERLTYDYRCLCNDGYAGDHCELDIDECASQPCRHGGVCKDDHLGFICECVDGFTGDTCDTVPDRCESTPCYSDGICVNRIMDFVCSCPVTHYGDFCEIEVTTTPAPTTTATTTTTTTLPVTTTSAPKAGVKNAGVPKGSKIGDSDSNVDIDDLSDDSSGSSGATSAAIIICLVAIAVVVLLAWFFFKQQRKNSDAMDEDSLIDLKNKTNKDDGVKPKEHREKSSPKKGNSRHFDLLNELQRISNEIITDEDSEADTKEKKRHNENKRKKNIILEQKKPTRVSTPPLDEIASDEERNPRKNDLKKGSNRKNNVDISPEDAARVLNQLLGKKRPRREISPKDARQAMQHVKHRQIDLSDTISMWSSDGDDRAREFRRKKKLRGRHVRSILKVPSHSPIQEESSSMSEAESEKGHEPSPRQAVLTQRELQHQKTLDPARKVSSWLKDSPPYENHRGPSPTLDEDDISDSSLSGPRRGRKKKYVIESDLTLEDFENDDEISTVGRSAFRPIHRNPYNPPPLPVTHNKAKSLVDKLLRPPLHSNQNFVGPTLGVKREKAFMG